MITEFFMKLVEDIKDRKGLGSEWKGTDSDTRSEIVNDWINILKELAKERLFKLKGETDYMMELVKLKLDGKSPVNETIVKDKDIEELHVTDYILEMWKKIDKIFLEMNVIGETFEIDKNEIYPACKKGSKWRRI